MALWWREPSLGSTLVDLAPLGALWVVARLVPTNLLVDISAVFVALVSATVPAAVLVEANASGGHLDRWEQRAQAPPQPGTDSINVYHLVFDGFEGALFRRIIGGFDLESRLGGFVFYENTYSNYTATSRSFPSFMTGRLFDAQTAEERVGEIGRSEGLVKTLAEHGYTVSQYNAYFINHHQRAHRRRSVTEIERRLYGDLRHLGELLDLSVLVSTPVAIKPLVIRDGTGPAGRWLRLTGQGIADWSRNPPLLSHMLAEQMLAEEADRPARGQYVLAHLLLPHAPFSLATDCEYQSRRRSTYVNLIEQTTCAVRIVVDLVEVLREHDRFRDALIVVHSDHGNLQKDRPLLLVKYPGRAGQPLETARHVVQLIDVAPTILEVLDLADPELPGVVLWNDTPHVRQEIQVWVSQP